MPAARRPNASATAYAKALGLPVEAIDSFTKDIKVSLKGLNAEEAEGHREGGRNTRRRCPASSASNSARRARWARR